MIEERDVIGLMSLHTNPKLQSFNFAINGIEQTNAGSRIHLLSTESLRKRSKGKLKRMTVIDSENGQNEKQ